MQDLGRVRALTVRAPGDVAVIESSDPSPDAGEVLVRIHACGVCGSDLNAWRGVPGIEYPLPPGAPGHEIWGEVVGVGSGVDGPGVGQLVTGLAWNGFAELGIARADNMLVVPERFGGAPTPGEPLRRARAWRLAGGGPREPVPGFGYLAALIVQLLSDDIESWMAVSRREDSRALARRLGASAAYDFAEVPSTAWDSFDVVIEAAGVQQTLDFATWLTAYAGRLVIAGYHADGPRTVNMQSWNWKGIDVINAHEREPSVHRRALAEAFDRLSLRRNIELASLLTHRWSLEQAGEAFRTAETRPLGFIKGVICP